MPQCLCCQTGVNGASVWDYVHIHIWFSGGLENQPMNYRFNSVCEVYYDNISVCLLTGRRYYGLNYLNAPRYITFPVLCVQMFLSLLSDLRNHVKMLEVSCGVRGEQPLQLTKCVFNSFWTTVRLSVEEERNGFELHGRYLGQFIVCFCLLIKTGDYFIEIFS